MRAHVLPSVLLVAACGGAQPATPKTSEKPAVSANESIGAEALARGGLSSLGQPGGSGSGALLAGSFKADLLEKESPVKLDGVVQEWPARTATQAVKGSAGKTAFTVGLQYDDTKLYVAGEITTSNFSQGADHASLVLAFPSGAASMAVHEIAFYPGKPGETAGDVRFATGAQKGRSVPGAKIVEAPSARGLTFEAVLPWSTFPEARLVRVGIRGVARYYDGGGSTVLATGPGDATTPTLLPSIPTESEQSLIEGLLAPKNIAQSPRVDVLADVAGDAMKERISVFDHYFTIVGPGYRGGKEFFYRDLGAEIVRLDARDVTGRGKDDLVLRRRFTTPNGTRESFEVWSCLGTDEPTTTFAHEIAIGSAGKHVDNAVHVAQKDIEVSVEPAAGWEAASYHEPTATDFDPILLPWGTVRSESCDLEGNPITKSKVVTQAAVGGPAAALVPRAEITTKQADPPTPSQQKGGDLSKQLLEQYRRDHAVGAEVQPRTDLQVHVDGDPRPERVVLIGRDVVVFGPGFKGGNAYAFLTLQQFADAADIKDLVARDLNGDGAADLIVRGVRHVVAQAGDTKTGQKTPTANVDMEVTFVYELRSGNITRVFSVETAREQGAKRVQGLVQFIPSKSGKSFEIDVRPGRAVGWTEQSYPWSQEQPGTGALEPLLLPWGGIPSLHYVWNGTAFAKP
jgi:hypothetical protein